MPTIATVIRDGLTGRTMPWLNSFHCGDHMIDAEHRQLIEACNDLCRLTENGADRAEAADAIDDLIATVNAHFASEEALFLRIDFPGESGHTREHRDISATMAELLTGGEMSLAQAAAIVRMLVVEHIIRHDLSFKTFILDAAGM